MISGFTGGNFFLSNFYEHAFELDGHVYHTVEHRYQAMKTLYYDEHRVVVLSRNAAAAKAAGRAVTLRADWEQVKLDVMRQALAAKFASFDSVLGKRLLATGDHELVEFNTWGDRYWGVYRGEGENWLGRLLMERRSELQS